jgi:hypothetical protein
LLFLILVLLLEKTRSTVKQCLAISCLTDHFSLIIDHSGIGGTHLTAEDAVSAGVWVLLWAGL